ncbi:MAG TPA: phospholipase D-like domain-containing protein [Burkholderiaceae bacterium]|nr:phospholipase D-like domain-containing protein [Burkholderiaceae bacterium]
MHARTLAANLNRPLIGGNRVDVLVDAAAAYEAMFAAIASARDHINLESYILEAEGPGEALANLLLKKRASGVRVNVIFDSFGSLRTSGDYFRRLREAGVALCEYNPVSVWRPLLRALHLRDHRKLLIVDGRIAFVGGINFSSVYAYGSAGRRRSDEQPPPPWRDMHVRIEGPLVTQLQEVFLEHWKCQVGRPPAVARYLPALLPKGGSQVGVAACDAGRRRNPFYTSLLAAIGTAQQRISITTAYFVPPRRLLRALERAARRGVDVRLLLPGISDSWPALAAGRSLYGRLLHAGVRIYECHDAILHAKAAVVDGVWATVGSSNMDWRSFLHNAEINVIGIDPNLARELERLHGDDVARGQPITLESWTKRGWTHRVKEWAARKAEFFL